MEKRVVNRSLITFLTLIVVLAIPTSDAFAHSDLLRSRPADRETLRQSPKTIELFFKKELQAVSMNSIVVTDQNGNRVEKYSVVISDDDKQMRTELEELRSGTYTVEWKALSADDHTIKGTFTFKVEIPVGSNAVPVAKPEIPLENVQAPPMTHQMPTQESGTSWWQSAVRWLMYLAMMTLFGGFAFRLLVLKPSLEQARDVTDEERVFGFEQSNNRFLRLTWLSLASLTAAAFASLILQTSAVLDVGVTQAFVPSRLFQVLTETSYGAPWLLQIAVILVLFVVVVFITGRGRRGESETDALDSNATLLWIGLDVSGMLFLAPGLTGHARAAASEYRLAIVSDCSI